MASDTLRPRVTRKSSAFLSALVPDQVKSLLFAHHDDDDDDYHSPDDPATATVWTYDDDDVVIIPASIRAEMKAGVSVWDLTVDFHRRLNAHHDYSTRERHVAQEVALDFFSSALVGCPLRRVPLSAPLVKRASSSIETWPNYVNGSDAVRQSVALVGGLLFRRYGVTESTVETKELPTKPYDEGAKERKASERLVEAWREAMTKEEEEGVVATGATKEVELLHRLVVYFGRHSERENRLVWKRLFPVLFEETELGKWVGEVFHHKKLLLDFHRICQEEEEAERGGGGGGKGDYEVTTWTAQHHDDDKYIPFQLVVYTMKWYYGDLGVLEDDCCCMTRE